ncbi:MAG TPA: GNAT family N-acyltransferase [Reyranellaceae bacterium]|nr:GNAT family N-acyltransferase [Reyranellaceae bacterium]
MRIDRADSESELLGPPISNAEIVKVVAGDFEVRLAQTAAEIDAAKALRYRVFYEEMAAKPTPEMAASKRDFDRYDDVCDHLLVLDRRRGEGPEGIVGNYRLIRRPAADKLGAFYSASEYDVGPMVNYPAEVLELGRSCIDKSARNTATMQMLWRGIALYSFHYNIQVMFGCASLPGTDPGALAQPLSYLHHHHLAPPEIRVRALPERYVNMNMLEPGSYDPRKAMARVPPLIKGYLRLGGYVGDGAVIDQQFNTTDVFIIVKTELVTEKYIRHYERGVR